MAGRVLSKGLIIFEQSLIIRFFFFSSSPSFPFSLSLFLSRVFSSPPPRSLFVAFSSGVRVEASAWRLLLLLGEGRREVGNDFGRDPHLENAL